MFDIFAFIQNVWICYYFWIVIQKYWIYLHLVHRCIFLNILCCSYIIKQNEMLEIMNYETSMRWQEQIQTRTRTWNTLLIKKRAGRRPALQNTRETRDYKRRLRLQQKHIKKCRILFKNSKLFALLFKKNNIFALLLTNK